MSDQPNQNEGSPSFPPSNNPFSDPNQQPGQVNPYATPDQQTAQHPPSLNQLASEASMVRQINVVSILSFAVAAFEFMFGTLMIIGASATLAGMQFDGPGPGNDVATNIAIAIVGVAVLSISILRIFAGIQFMKFKGKNLFLTSLCVGLVTVFTCYCAPMSLGIFIYGLIVVRSPGVARACQMRKSGMSAQEVKRYFDGAFG